MSWYDEMVAARRSKSLTVSAQSAHDDEKYFRKVVFVAYRYF